MSRLKSVSKQGWILIFIVAVGIFLRTYNFSQWLYFYPDQARDITIVSDYLNGKGHLPLLGFKAASTNFQLGAMYYYFQIISAKIFGVGPAQQAYPDVFFGILAIPLLYYFLRKYFSINLALAMAGLYSVSFYIIRYSRFAWNSNSIPFFVILFLLSLYELLVSKGKTHWAWVAAVGLTLGVGVQLHTVLLVLLPVVTLLALVYTIKYDTSVWKKWIAIFLIAIALNTGQVISELKTNFQNTGYFFDVLGARSPGESSGVVSNLVENVVCQSQSNVLYLSSMENNDNCDTVSYFIHDKGAKQDSFTYWTRIFSITFGFVGFVFGYALLIYFARSESDEKKKIFLYMNFVYGALAFLVILPIITHNGQVRYYLPIVFLPFLSLGLMAKYLSEKLSTRYHWLGLIALTALVGLNFSTIFAEAEQSAALARSNAQYVVLDELEEINSYIQSHSSPQKEAYVYGGQKYMQNFYKPLAYVASEDGFTVARVGDHPTTEVPAGKSYFFIAQSVEATHGTKFDSAPADFGLNVESYKSFGNIGVYKIKN